MAKAAGEWGVGSGEWGGCRRRDRPTCANSIELEHPVKREGQTRGWGRPMGSPRPQRSVSDAGDVVRSASCWAKPLPEGRRPGQLHSPARRGLGMRIPNLRSEGCRPDQLPGSECTGRRLGRGDEPLVCACLFD
jgi:hypothetical protein